MVPSTLSEFVLAEADISFVQLCSNNVIHIAASSPSRFLHLLTLIFDIDGDHPASICSTAAAVPS